MDGVANVPLGNLTIYGIWCSQRFTKIGTTPWPVSVNGKMSRLVYDHIKATMESHLTSLGLFSLGASQREFCAESALMLLC